MSQSSAYSKVRVFPVIHVEETPSQGHFNPKWFDSVCTSVSIQIETAMAAGADGVFFNNYGKIPLNAIDMCLLSNKVMHDRKFEKFPIGVNYLGVSNLRVAKEFYYQKHFALWVDSSGIVEPPVDESENEAIQHHIAQTLVRDVKMINSKAEVFGSIAFKGQPQVRDLKSVTKLAGELFDVVVTSGTRTGSAPDVQKIKEMRGYLNELENGYNIRLAVASGVSAGNVPDFISVGATDILVNTSICKKQAGLDMLDYEPLRQLVLAVRNS